MTKRCKHCNGLIAFDIFWNGWYHTSTEAVRCRDDASFTFAEPK